MLGFRDMTSDFSPPGPTVAETVVLHCKRKRIYLVAVTQQVPPVLDYLHTLPLLQLLYSLRTEILERVFCNLRRVESVVGHGQYVTIILFLAH